MALAPDAAAACATCVDSAYASRTFNWAFVGLMLAPFAVAIGLFGGIAWACRRWLSSGDAAMTTPTAEDRAAL